MPVRYAVIIPACNEEPCIASTVAELRQVLDPQVFELCIGVNGSSDRTAELARGLEVVVAETSQRGYGHGCQAAVQAISGTPVAAYIFFAADGANDPQDIPELVTEHERGADMVLGARTTLRSNWSVMGFHHVLANRLLGLWCAALTGRWFQDIGPLRLIETKLFQRMHLCEWTFGWTIEAQVRAAQLGARMVEVPVHERRRIAGEQKVSRLSWQHSLRIGATIFAAGWRTRFPPAKLVAQKEPAPKVPVAPPTSA